MWVKELEGDLDGIVMIAMRKEPARRYASVDMLRQDVERHLAGLPVMAHRGGRRYRMGKFVRRHRVEAAAATAAIAALMIGLSVAVLQGRRATRERDRAEQALAESNGVSDFLLELFRTGETGDVPATQLTALDLLQRGALQADDLSNQPMVHARLLDVIGQMSFNLGRLDEAQARLEQAVAIRRSTGGVPEDLARGLIHLSWVHRTRNQHHRARPLVMEALDLRRRSLPAGHPDIADALYELGWIAFGAEQERLYRQALEILTPIPAAAARRMTMLQAIATNLRRQGRLPEAVAAARDALAVAEGSYGPEHHTTGSAMIHLGDHVNDIEEDGAGDRRFARAGSVGVMLLGRGDVAPAEAQLLESLSSLERAYGGRVHPNVHETKRVLMTLYRQTGRPDLVERYRVPPGRFIPY